MGWSKKGVSQEDMEKRAEQKGKRYGGSGGKGYILDNVIKSFVPQEGENCIRIVEPIEVDGLGYYGLDVHFHREVGHSKDYYLCLKNMREVLEKVYNKKVEGRCFVDEQQTSEMWDENPDLAKTFFPDHRVLMFVLDLNGKDPSELLLWSCAITLSEDIIGQSKRKGSNTYIDVSSPTDGHAVYFDRIGKGRSTKYKNVQVGDEAVPLPDQIEKDRVKFLDLLIIPTYDEVKDAFLNVMDGETPSYDEPEEPEEPEIIDDKFTELGRAELKKLVKKANKEFVVYKTTSDEEIRHELRLHEELDEPEPPEDEEEPEPEKPEDEGDADSVKERLRKAIEKRKAQTK